MVLVGTCAIRVFTWIIFVIVGPWAYDDVPLDHPSWLSKISKELSHCGLFRTQVVGRTSSLCLLFLIIVPKISTIKNHAPISWSVLIIACVLNSFSRVQMSRCSIYLETIISLNLINWVALSSPQVITGLGLLSLLVAALI